MRAEIGSRCRVVGDTIAKSGVSVCDFEAVLVVATERGGGAMTKIQHSDDGQTWTDCKEGTEFIRHEAGVLGGSVSYIGDKKYIKVADGVDGACIIGFNKPRQP